MCTSACTASARPAELPTVTASLWRLAPGGVVTRCYDGIQLTNGIGISPDGARLYHNDTALKRSG